MSFGGNFSKQDIPVFSNTNNDIYLFTTVDETPSYQLIPVNETTSEVALTIPGNDLKTDMVEKSIDLSGISTSLKYVNIKVDAYGPTEELNWRRSLNSARYSINNGEIPTIVNTYLPSDLSWFSYYESDIEMYTEGDNILHYYTYYNEVPSSVELITDLSVSSNAGNIQVNGAYDVALVDHDYYKAETNGNTSFHYFVFSNNAESTSADIPESVWALMKLNEEDLASFTYKTDVTLWRSTQFGALFNGDEWSEEALSEPLTFQEVYFNDITGSGSDNGGRARKNTLERSERRKGLFSRNR